jgi:hypothetical protein
MLGIKHVYFRLRERIELFSKPNMTNLGDTMRFGIHNLLREKIEQFSDEEEENIEVEETDNEEHEEEEEMEEEAEQDKEDEEANCRLPSERLAAGVFKDNLHAEEVSTFFQIMFGVF